MNFSIRHIYKAISGNHALVVSIILFIGLVFASGSADVAGLKTGQTGLSTGKIYRVITVGLAAVMAIFYIVQKGDKGINELFKGSLLLLFIYTLLAFFTVVFSQLKSMTLFKSFEFSIICIIGALVLAEYNRSSTVKTFIHGIFIIYIISCISALLETIIFGNAHNRMLVVGETPLLSAMMHSSYPPMVGNALGFLGALAAMYCIYLFDRTKITFTSKTIALTLFFISVTVLFLSYTRSAMVFFIISLLIYFLFEKRYGRFFAILFIGISLLAVPSIQNKVIAHMKRGATDEQLASFSGRTEFWENVFSRDPAQLLVGEGFATGTLFQNYGKQGGTQIYEVRNAHNSIAEIVMSSGFLGLSVWLLLLLRIFRQLLFIRRHLKYQKNQELIHFNNFIFSVFILSALRTNSNSSFVYMDYFIFTLLVLIVYTESMKRDIINNNLDNNTQEEPLDVVDTDILQKRDPRILSLRK